jgi:deoxyribodipyrimidine photolyase
VWLRRDLRVDDHAALHHALTQARQVWCCFVFDRDILDALPGQQAGPAGAARTDRRVEFIRDSLVGVALTDGARDIMLFSSAGKAVRFEDAEVRPMGWGEMPFDVVAGEGRL